MTTSVLAPVPALLPALSASAAAIKGVIKSWSYSRLVEFEKCAYSVKLKHVDKLGTTQHPAAERGTAIHLQAEQYVDGTIDKLPSTLAAFTHEFESLRDYHAAGMVGLEEEWGFDHEWLPSGYREGWLRMKGDAIIFLPTQHAVVIDYKTGRKDGNEIKHAEQVLLYAIATFIRNPELETVTVELWYLDKKDKTVVQYTRAQALRYLQGFDKRANKLTNATQFPANPTAYTCQWCDFSATRGGQCEYSVGKGESPLKFYREKFG